MTARNLREVLDCASPLALWDGCAQTKAAEDCRTPRRSRAEPSGSWSQGAIWVTSAALVFAVVNPLPLSAAEAPSRSALALAAEARQFLEMYNRSHQPLFAAAEGAAWDASTNVTEENTGKRIGAQQAKAAFAGNTYVIEQTREFLKHRDQLDELTVRQLNKILLLAAECPGTIPEAVAARVAAEARLAALQDGFTFKLPQADGTPKTVTPNQIQEILSNSTNVSERLRAWETSKQAGPALKPGLLELRDFRNRVARELGYHSYFDLQVADYGMSVAEMRALTEQLVREMQPLYQQLHCWARHKLAERYGQPVSKLIPAHWLPNRWGQEWGGLVESVNLDEALKSKRPEWLIHTAEQFYVSLGFPGLPKTFYTKSDLYELPPDAKRKKNTHASAWHINLDQDVRSLMSVKPDFDWFATTHHELGHIYYYLAYANPSVPLVLREGANRAFHEGLGELVSTAVRQAPYLQQMHILPAGRAPDQVQWLLNEALSEAVVFIPWSAGVMTAWEHDFYEQELTADQLNRRWWEYVAKYQGIAPPTPRGEEFCDAATKTHVIDDAAQYYDYALAFALKYQLHLHIAKKILKQDPHACNYYGNREAGRFLQNILKLGATRDWRRVLRENLGEEISARAMLEYYAPLLKYLQEQNQGREVGW